MDLLPTQSKDDGDETCKASDAANSSSYLVTTTINDENAPPNEMRAIDDLRDGFLPLSKLCRLFVGSKRRRISGSVAIVIATVPTETTMDSAVTATTAVTMMTTTPTLLSSDNEMEDLHGIPSIDYDKKPPLPLEWTRIGKSPTDSFDVVEIEEVKWGMRICNCGCQEIADPTTSVLFHDEHGNNQAWLSEEFNTQTDYSVKLVPIRIPSNLKHVEMYREAAREMRSLLEYRDDYVFVEYLIHLMIQEVNCDNMLQSIVIQVTLCSTARLGASMAEYGWTNKGNSEKSPSKDVGDALSDAFAWPDNATDYMNSRNFATIVAWQSCRLVCMKKCLTACSGTYANGCKGMHCQPFTTKEAIFKAGVIIIACKVWAK